MARDTYICLSTAKQHNEPRYDQRKTVIICLVSTVPWRHAALMRLILALAINRVQWVWEIGLRKGPGRFFESRCGHNVPL
jgi:hypothetical protein